MGRFIPAILNKSCNGGMDLYKLDTNFEVALPSESFPPVSQTVTLSILTALQVFGAKPLLKMQVAGKQIR